jgi:hypothetical protein
MLSEEAGFQKSSGKGKIVPFGGAESILSPKTQGIKKLGITPNYFLFYNK